MRVLLAISFLFVASLSIGCGKSGECSNCKSSASDKQSATDADDCDCCKECESASGAIEVKTTTFKDFTAAVASHKGKIVVIDMWGTFCIPCKKEFHNLVEIHKKHAADGVVCLSVAIAPSESDEALAFLKSQKASFGNYLLNEEQTKELTEAWDFGAVPALFVIDRSGKRHDFTLDDPRNQRGYEEAKELLSKLIETKAK